MRRSKSNPAKYAKNYRSISQRRMIRNQDADDEAEMDRLRTLLSSSNNDDDDDIKDIVKVAAPSENPEESVLSKEMMEEYGADETPILLATKKKDRTLASSTAVTLTPQELKQAAQERKKATRKLQQLEQRHAQKQKRAELYQKLADTALPSTTQQLLTRTASYSKRTTKREALQRSLQKERAGMTLTPEEHDLLYPSRPNCDNNNTNNKKRNRPEEFMSAMDPPVVENEGNNSLANSGTKQSKIIKMESDDVNNPNVPSPVPPTNSVESKAPSSAAAQLMASLHMLQSKSSEQADQSAQEKERVKREQAAELERLQQAEKPIQRYIPAAPIEIKTTQSYETVTVVPQQPTTNGRSLTRVREIQRPPEVTATRYDLPVAGMEFEIVDAIRNHDVTILCAETGSGKSTQVPQFLYESGFTSTAGEGQDGNSDSNHKLMIAVTQPRRVAAVSTAKRVCYEMGHGNGQTITNNSKRQGNVVAYQTRYETAGLGSQTHIKFMTDGILLQEIQSDLLLRQYSCIVLDEAHERNLNTDVLIGLIRGALRLRRQALEEAEGDLSSSSSSLPPLKVVIMSATLRVQDFTNVFDQPAVVQVPGRMHPVTVHHSRVTELDNYEDEAFRKTCKIHRQLRQGSILVFLTGKQEIVRMVNRLRRALNNDRRDARKQIAAVDIDVEEVDSGMSNNIARDMDDDEADGELFQEQEEPDDFDDAETEEALPRAPAPIDGEDNDDPLPQKAIVLPLYSLMSTEEQTKVFASVPEGHRLIVVATNIAETSITIPGVCYVVDSGRQKCRNYNADTGVASFDIMWISKAQADQRAGRAGRTAPGHCYRLYSSSLYSRHMDDFALPEVLTRPLEDVVLAMKAMRISNVADFPFPTAPDKRQLDAAVKLLSNIGCVDTSALEENGGDGTITRLGAAIAKLPLGVRYGKMLLVAAQAGVLDYAVVVVAALSESNPFLHDGQTNLEPTSCGDGEVDEQSDSDVEDARAKKEKRSRWKHSGGDVLAALLAVGAYTYAGRGAGGASEKLAYKIFCEENGLNPVIMERIQKMRRHLARLCKVRLGSAEGTAAKTGGFVCSMLPPNPLQEKLLCQSIASGLLDNVAMLAPVGSIPGEHPFSLRSAYLCCSSSVKEPLFMDRNSVAYSRDPRMLPQWICYDTLIRKKRKDGTSFAAMKNITPIDASWLGRLAKDSRLLVTGDVLSTPNPVYDSHRDSVMCSVRTKFGCHGWEVPPLEVEMFDALHAHGAKKRSAFLSGDSFRWFARFLFEGKVLPELSDLKDMLTDIPSLITRQMPSAKVELLVSALSNAGIDNAAALRKQWAEVDDKFLFSIMKKWIKSDRAVEFRKLWIQAVKHNIRLWNETLNSNQTIASNP